MESKWFLKSKTIWGALIGFLPSLLMLVGIAPDPEAISALSQAGSNFLDGAWALLNSGNEVIGAALVVWGRLTAKAPLKVA